jgi:hypothetical protein
MGPGRGMRAGRGCNSRTWPRRCSRGEGSGEVGADVQAHGEEDPGEPAVPGSLPIGGASGLGEAQIAQVGVRGYRYVLEPAHGVVPRSRSQREVLGRYRTRHGRHGGVMALAQRANPGPSPARGSGRVLQRGECRLLAGVSGILALQTAAARMCRPGLAAQVTGCVRGAPCRPASACRRLVARREPVARRAQMSARAWRSRSLIGQNRRS